MADSSRSTGTRTSAAAAMHAPAPQGAGSGCGRLRGGCGVVARRPPAACAHLRAERGQQVVLDLLLHALVQRHPLLHQLGLQQGEDVAAAVK